MSLRILTIDIETAPGTGYFWGLWDQNIAINQVISPSRIICVAGKWLDSKDLMFTSEHLDSPEEMLMKVYGWMEEADVVVGYNSKKFDVKHLNREFFLAKFDPPSPFQQVDLMEASKKKFTWMSNKLQWLLTETKIGSKIEHEGFALWTACMAGDDAAWSRMRKYCENDVRETEKLYKEMLPWIPNHPSHGAFEGENCCPQCGSHKLQMQGFAYTSTGKYQRYKCQDCRKWTKSNRRLSSTAIVGIA